MMEFGFCTPNSSAEPCTPRERRRGRRVGPTGVASASSQFQPQVPSPLATQIPSASPPSATSYGWAVMPFSLYNILFVMMLRYPSDLLQP